jgi:hypothetical protein
MELTAHQLSRLLKAHQELTAVLADHGMLDGAPQVAEPQWKTTTAKQWALLKAVQDAGGDLSSAQWGRLGKQHGYDPRGLGGFFRGSEQLMEASDDRRILSDYGRRFIERWAPDFADRA